MGDAIIGFGRVAQMLRRKAALGLGMRVVGCDIELPEEFARVLAEADFGSLHVASIPTTRHLAGTRFFRRHKARCLPAQHRARRHSR